MQIQKFVIYLLKTANLEMITAMISWLKNHQIFPKTQPELLRLVFNFCFAGLVASMFLHIKHPINSSYSFLTGEKKDFTIIFAYLSDILIIACISLSWLTSSRAAHPTKAAGYNKNQETRGSLLYILVILITFAYISQIYQYPTPNLALYYYYSLIKLLVLHEALFRYPYTHDLKKIFVPIFLLFMSFEVLLGLYQFAHFHDLGLQRIGESAITNESWDIAKVETPAGQFIRPYGTFPHPNIFGAFVVVALLISLKKLLNINKYLGQEKTPRLFFYSMSTFLSTFGLIISFSRAAWLAGGIAASILVLSRILKQPKFFPKNWHFIIGMLGSALAIAVLFAPLIFSRTKFADSSQQERQIINRAGLSMIKGSPLLGVGPGQSLLHMEQYSPPKTMPWDIQPIHNYYLLIVAEYGVIIGIVYFAYLLLPLVLYLTRLIYKKENELNIFWLGTFACLLLMFWDHYFYTLEQGRLLFWLIFSLAILSAKQESIAKTESLET